MSNYYRSRSNRDTGSNWQERAGYEAQRNRMDYDDYRNYGSGYDSDNERHRSRQDYGSEAGWRYRNMREQDEYGTGYGRSGAAGYGSGSYGISDYVRRPAYDSQQGYHGYGSAGSYNSDWGYQGRQRSRWGCNRPGYGRDYDAERSSRRYEQEDYNSGDRDWWDRTTDEVASWFGDEEAERRRHLDKQQNFRGRGPKGYRRSDDRIREDINDRLSDDPWVDASDIEVAVSNGEVTLSGHVPERQAKRRAEDIVESVSGVANVENRIRVSPGFSDSYVYPTAATTGGSTDLNSKVENGRSRGASSGDI